MDEYAVERMIDSAVSRVRGDLEHEITMLERRVDDLRSDLQREREERRQADSTLSSQLWEATG